MIRSRLRHAAVLAAVLAGLLAEAAPDVARAGAGVGDACTGTSPIVAGSLDGVRARRVSCDLTYECPLGTAGGCVMTFSIEVAGAGFVEARLEAPWGDLDCAKPVGWHVDVCSTRITVGVHRSSRPYVATCLATGFARDVTVSCSAE